MQYVQSILITILTIYGIHRQFRPMINERIHRTILMSILCLFFITMMIETIERESNARSTAYGMQ